MPPLGRASALKLAPMHWLTVYHKVVQREMQNMQLNTISHVVSFSIGVVNLSDVDRVQKVASYVETG